MIADEFPISKSLFVIETTGLILNLGTISKKCIIKVFANPISEVSTFLFSIKVMFLVVNLFQILQYSNNS